MGYLDENEVREDAERRERQRLASIIMPALNTILSLAPALYPADQETVEEAADRIQLALFPKDIA